MSTRIDLPAKIFDCKPVNSNGQSSTLRVLRSKLFLFDGASKFCGQGLAVRLLRCSYSVRSDFCGQGSSVRILSSNSFYTVSLVSIARHKRPHDLFYGKFAELDRSGLTVEVDCALLVTHHLLLLVSVWVINTIEYPNLRRAIDLDASKSFLGFNNSRVKITGSDDRRAISH